MFKEDYKCYGIIFWIHLLFFLFALFSFLLFSWWLIIIGQIILLLQYFFINGCILSKAEFGRDESFMPYYLYRWGLIENKQKGRIFVRYYLPCVVIILAIILQIVFEINPLIY
jgi:hypothetical protein